VATTGVPPAVGVKVNVAFVINSGVSSFTGSSSLQLIRNVAVTIASNTSTLCEKFEVMKFLIFIVIYF
jgi:hypothetical protein